MFRPKIIQAGMGVNISCWLLAWICSRFSTLGKEVLATISGTALERVTARILQKGGAAADEIVEILKYFPFPEMARRVVERYYNKPKVGIPTFTLKPSRTLIELTICANFAHVALAKRGHNNPISINYLRKIGMPHLYAIYGAMLAGVDYVTMGAGIAIDIPAIILAYFEGRSASCKIPVIGGEDFEMCFDPEAFFGRKVNLPRRPGFIPIISSNVLAAKFLQAIERGIIPIGSIFGFVVEEPTAGGHNAPPRNKTDYGPKDLVDYLKLAALGLPFWIAGSYASPEKLAWALSVGASGIQVGSMFALCNDSGMRPDLRKQAISDFYHGILNIKTDHRASPTGFPFKVAELAGTVSEDKVYRKRRRVCDQRALVDPVQTPEGGIVYRCASEPEAFFVRKGGRIEETEGRKCICNGLLVAAGLGDEDDVEPPIVTLGDDLSFLKHLALKDGVYAPDGSYTAEDAVRYIFSAS